jgi:hypothetical protein
LFGAWLLGSIDGCRCDFLLFWMEGLNVNSVVEIGRVPWSVDDILGSYDEFKRIYLQKPVRNNDGGMKAPHAFACWFMMKNLKPDLIIESGIWKGQGTWLIEKACPEADVVCLDVDLSKIEYRSSRAVYFEKDFSVVDFSEYDKSNAICFFDDHQNAFFRLQQMKWKGFSRAIFEDNYPKLRGDCYSLKKAFEGVGFKESMSGQNRLKCAVKNTLVDFFKLGCRSDVQPNITHRTELQEKLDVYYEFPPLFVENLTRWGDEWDFNVYPTKSPIFNYEKQDSLKAEANSYNWMAYVDLK